MIPRIEYAFPELSQEREEFLRSKGYRPFDQYAIPKFIDPMTTECIMLS